MTPGRPLRTVEWIGDLDGCVRIIDQTRLPEELAYLDIREVESMWEAILAVRLDARTVPILVPTSVVVR